MKVIIKGKIIPNHRSHSNMCKILSDPKSFTILNLVQQQPKTVCEISHLANISLQKTYRLLQFLTNVGLLTKSFRIGKTGRKMGIYQSRVSKIIFE